jgi:hypothetical protein
MSQGDKRRRQLQRLFNEQGGLCFYCRQAMVITPHGPGKKVDPRKATTEHLDDRFNPVRGKHGGSGAVRHVAACYECNFERGRESQASQPIELLRERASHGHRKRREAK